ncbi:hypothetical protein PbB2_00051 [Candidatus Phycosocius bacilliformis]|uniref:Uncharacterized protein n=1 Tax=Candidatus Phycosocius bacilliformis TaxID=1445552 RepID=A0A2P2E5R0_9PROT|nr:hypothetical protein [Candidatus Phycosocius bacilliformis]GBF56396.1 hypothetical protein PbB2_00051 [Candidatus Phycosocius bacilliformis]
MAEIPDALLARLASELDNVRQGTAGLEGLVSAGATTTGTSGVMAAQTLDQILQTLDSLSRLLTQLSHGGAVQDALTSLPLAHLAERLGQQGFGSPGLNVLPRPSDPELF